MALPLSTDTSTPTPRELLQELEARVADWSDPRSAASAAAELLHAGLAGPTVSVYRYDAAAGNAVLLATAPARPDAPAVGSRVAAREGILAAAVRERSTQTVLNAYVAPDFVRSLPGETRSGLAVPLRASGEVLGVIHLEYASPARPGAADQEAAELVAHPLAVALAAAAAGVGAAPADPGRLRRAALLGAVSANLAGSSDPAATLRQAVDAAPPLLACEGAILLLRQGSRQILEVAAVAGAVPLALAEPVSMDGSLPGSVARDGQPRMLMEMAGAAEPFSPAHPGLDLRSALLVPVASGGQTLGVLGVLNRVGAEPFSADEVDFLQSLAAQLGAVESLRQGAALRQRLSDSSLIAEVGRAVTGTLGLDEVLALVVQSAQMLISGQSATVGILDPKRQEVELLAAAGRLRRSQGTSIPLEGTLLGWSIARGEAVITPSAADDPRGWPHDVRQGAAVVVPLESRGQVRGALMAARADGAPTPSEEDLDALRKLASYAAIAIDNARLYEEQTEMSRALRAKTVELEGAYAELRASQERLLVSEKMAALGRVTAGIAHEINSPLGSVLNCLQLAQTYAQEYSDSAGSEEVTADDHRAIAKDILESLSLAEGAARKVAQFVRTIKEQTRTGEEGVCVFAPQQEIERMLVLLQHQVRDRNVTLRTELEPELRLTGDPGKFSALLQNLLSNAIDAYGGAPGEVWVRMRTREERVVLEVEDRGCGIPEEIRGRIFDYLFTTKDVGQGTGLGLSIVHSLVTSHFNAEIELRSEVGAGTTFTITFPVPVETE